MIVLYEFAISHYCEKIRWALEFKNIEYQKRTLIPGPHIFTTKKLSKVTSVPIIKDGNRVVQNSKDIISYLDETYPEKPLTPKDNQLANEAIEWENFIDKEIGIHLRRAVYNVLLEHPNTLIPIFCVNKPIYSRWIMRAMFGPLSWLMRKAMNINEQSAERSRTKLREALGVLSDRYSESDYLVGSAFTRADLAASALLAPLECPRNTVLALKANHPGNTLN